MTIQSRDRTEIIRQILDTANSAEGITKIKLMYMSFLTYRQVKEYLVLLTENHLLFYDSLTHTYKTNEKGVRLLKFCNKLEDIMKGLQPSQQPRKQQAA